MSRRLKAMGKPNDRNGVFFFKQWGCVRKKRNGRLLDGRTWDEMPAAAFAG
jgi:protein gp37